MAKRNPARDLANIRWKGRLSPTETRKAVEQLLARLHIRKDVAAYLSVSRQTVYNYLTGKHRGPATLRDKVTELADSKNTA